MSLKKTISLSTLILFLIPGCSTRQYFETVNVPPAQMQAYLADRPQSLHNGYRKLLVEGKRNAVLNNLQIGIDAYQFGYKQEAAAAFDQAISGINTIYADNEDAAKARSIWYEEGQKDFKGEPYERVMAFYYRGLLDLETGDFENARASFKTGILQDAFAEEDQNRCDFATIIFLEGWASLMNGDEEMASYAFAEVKKLRPDFTVPDKSSALIIIETGTAPRKVADGPGHSELKFRRGRNFNEYRAEISIDNGPYTGAYPLEDIFWQASTRGGRPVDKIIKGKAVFRSNAEKVGSSLSEASDKMMLASSPLSSVPIAMGVGAALGLVSVTHLALAARSRPHADTRYWNNLPDTVHIATTSLAPGEHTIKVRYRDKNMTLVPGLFSTKHVIISEQQPSFVWVRSRNLLSENSTS